MPIGAEPRDLEYLTLRRGRSAPRGDSTAVRSGSGAVFTQTKQRLCTSLPRMRTSRLSELLRWRYRTYAVALLSSLLLICGVYVTGLAAGIDTTRWALWVVVLGGLLIVGSLLQVRREKARRR